MPLFPRVTRPSFVDFTTSVAELLSTIIDPRRRVRRCDIKSDQEIQFADHGMWRRATFLSRPHPSICCSVILSAGSRTQPHTRRIWVVSIQGPSGQGNICSARPNQHMKTRTATSSVMGGLQLARSSASSTFLPPCCCNAAGLHILLQRPSSQRTCQILPLLTYMIPCYCDPSELNIEPRHGS